LLYFEKFATVKDVISYKEAASPDAENLIRIPSNASIKELIEYLAEKKVGVAMVNGPDDEIIGVISERDVIRQLAYFDEQALDMPIETILTREIEYCYAQEKLKSVAAHMADKHIRHIAIKNDDDKYIGVISSSDIDLFAGEG
jgi:CBS domain-containing protein